jgi:hypothetical protein
MVAVSCGIPCRVVRDIMLGFGAALRVKTKTAFVIRGATVNRRARPDIVKVCVSALRSSSITVESQL